MSLCKSANLSGHQHPLSQNKGASPYHCTPFQLRLIQLSTTTYMISTRCSMLEAYFFSMLLLICSLVLLLITENMGESLFLLYIFLISMVNFRVSCSRSGWCGDSRIGVNFQRRISWLIYLFDYAGSQLWHWDLQSFFAACTLSVAAYGI